MTSFLLRYNRRTGELDITEFTGDHAREDALSARVDAEVARTILPLNLVSFQHHLLHDPYEIPFSFPVSACPETASL